MSASHASRRAGWRRAGRWLVVALAGFTLLVAALLAFFAWHTNDREIRSISDAAPSTGRFISAEGIQIFVQEEGPAGGTPVLLIHGTGAWSEIWRETMVFLAEHGYRAIAIDVPPFGYSAKPDGAAAYSRQTQAARILGVLDGAGVSRAIVVAHSVGARPAVEAALQEPARIERLVLVDPALGFDADRQSGPRFEQNAPSWLVRRLFAARTLRDAAIGAYATNPAATRRLFTSFVSRRDAVTDARVAMLQQPLSVQQATRAYGDWFEYLVTSEDTSLSSDFSNFRRLVMPVGIVWGRADTVTPLWQGQTLRDVIPGSQLAVIEGAGHIPYIEAPGEFNQILLTLIESSARAGQ